MKARTLTLVVRAVAAGIALLLAAVAIVAQPGAALAGLVIGATVGAAVALAPRPGTATAQTAAGARRAGLTAFTGVCAGWLVATGLVVLCGPSGWVIALVVGLAVVAPRWMARWIWGPPGTGAARPGPTAATAELSFDLQALSTPQLCEAWQRSYSALLHAPPGPAHDELVRIRGELLDELDRRDHAGFTRWLEAGARAGSDPSRYLSAGR